MTEQRLTTFSGDITPLIGWFVTSGHPLIQQRFYAAIDSSGLLCWTDDLAAAEQFPLREDAERFASLLCPNEDWSVIR
ncbi:hypothetical protein [Lichenifustis flavocetrariae]|uniref:Uncharacterized protein n=1 Tax=Lichenifustis flavocetrariae TaxID=2949735 RepID=A0AA42CKU9_9HYPH|nr:hypothetical protein [Lichenifustis flavocetrariae]MCW6506665.1 hypothetical protein [Lichenifustis flavocetrariae]